MVSVRTLALAAAALGLLTLFAYNVSSLVTETGPRAWAAAAGAALGGGLAYVVLAARPPAVLQRLTGVRGALLPVLGLGVAMLVVSTDRASWQLAALAFFGGLLGTAAAFWAVRRRG